MSPVHPAPLLYQINLRALLGAVGERLGRAATLGDVPDRLLDRLAAQGFGWVWLLGVWRTGEAGRRIARSIPELMEAYRRVLPDLAEDDICGSCFAVAGYEVPAEMGGDAALLALRERMRARGLRLMLDFVPNHTARDHPWVRSRPQLYRQGGAGELDREPWNWFRAETADGPAILAHGRDPNFPGWTDTAQLDYARPEPQAAMEAELLRISALCDGLRCDMAMLLLPDVFERSWGVRPAPFWPNAIARVRRAHPGFTFLAEAYWNLEWPLLQDGFDLAYDKRLYDRLSADAAGPVRNHLRADPGFQRRLARFLENHDEERAAAALPAPRHRAAALIAYLTPGLKFFQDGQLQGHRARLPVQLCRAPKEAEDAEIAAFYAALLELLRSGLPAGEWRLLDPPADAEAAIVFRWTDRSGGLLVAVNFADPPLRFELPSPEAGSFRVRLAAGEVRARPAAIGFDLPAWGYAAIELSQ
jgi:glycosidase